MSQARDQYIQTLANKTDGQLVDHFEAIVRQSAGQGLEHVDTNQDMLSLIRAELHRRMQNKG